MLRAIQRLLGWRYLPFFVYLGVALIILRVSLLGDVFGLQHDWSYPLLNYNRLHDAVRYIWSAENNGIIPLYRTNAITDTVIAVIGIVTHVPPQLLYKIILVGLFSGSGAAIYLLMRNRQYPRLAAFLAGLFYLTSTVIMTRAITGYFGYLVSAATFPLLLLYYYKAVEESVFRARLRSIACMSLISAFAFYQVHFIAFFVWFFLVDLFMQRIPKRSYRGAILAGLGTVLGYALCNLFWIVPIFQNFFSSGNQSASLASQVALASRGATLPAGIWDTVIMQSHAVTAPILHVLNEGLRARILIGVILLVLLVCAAYNKKRRLLVGVFVTLVLLTLPIALGPSSPLGSIDLAMQDIFPVLKIFREPYHLAYLMLLFWTFVLCSAAEWCLTRTFKLRVNTKKICVGIAFAGMIILVNLPSLTGTYFGYFGSANLPENLEQTNTEIRALTLGRVYYPPNLNFWRLKDDTRFGVNYPDQIGLSMDRLPVTGASSDLEVRNDAWQLRNAVTSALVHRDPAFPSLLNFLGSDLSVYRPYLSSHFAASVGLDSVYTPQAAQWVGHNYQSDLVSYGLIRQSLSDGSTAFQLSSKVSPVSSVSRLAHICSFSDVSSDTKAFVASEPGTLARFTTESCSSPTEKRMRDEKQVVDLAATRGLKHAPRYGWTPGDLAFYVDPILANTLVPFVVTGQQDTIEVPITTSKKTGMLAFYLAWPLGGELKIGKETVSTLSPVAEWRSVVVDTESVILPVNSLSGFNAFAGAVENVTVQPKIVQRQELAESTVLSKQIAPTYYEGQLVNNSEKPTLVSLAENYNQGWELSVGNTRYSSHRINGWQNAFLVPAGVSGEFSITFVPQRQYTVLYFLSMLVLVLLAVYASSLRPRIPKLNRKS